MNDNLDPELRDMVGMPSRDEQGPFCLLPPKSGAPPALTLEKVSDGRHTLSDPTVSLYRGEADRLMARLDRERPIGDPELPWLESASDLHTTPIMPRSVRRGGSRTVSLLDLSTAEVLTAVADRMPVGPAARFARKLAGMAREGGVQ